MMMNETPITDTTIPTMRDIVFTFDLTISVFFVNVVTTSVFKFSADCCIIESDVVC